jgi:hypothetical protein
LNRRERERGRERDRERERDHCDNTKSDQLFQRQISLPWPSTCGSVVLVGLGVRVALVHRSFHNQVYIWIWNSRGRERETKKREKDRKRERKGEREKSKKETFSSRAVAHSRIQSIHILYSLHTYIDHSLDWHLAL